MTNPLHRHEFIHATDGVRQTRWLPEVTYQALTLEEFVERFIPEDEDAPPGTVKRQKLLYALDRYAVSGYPLGCFEKCQRTPDKMGYYYTEWQDDNPFKENFIFIASEK